MTCHVHYDHKCAKCETGYIPYDDQVPCPKCGVIENERFDFISEAVRSLRFNKSTMNSYAPTAWIITSFADHILSFIFSVYLSYEAENPSNIFSVSFPPKEKKTSNFQEFAEAYMSEVEWGENEHMKDYLLKMVLRIHDELKKEDEN